MPDRRIRTAVSVLGVLVACHRAPTPDPRYEQARELYGKLYAAGLDDAYADPRMDEVVTLLNQVDPGSGDAPSAKAMLGVIATGREAVARQRAEREKMAAAASVGIKAVTDINPDRVLAASAPPPDAGPPPDAYGAGASLAELNASSGGCLAGMEPFTENGTGKTGTVYRLTGSPVCASKLPGFVGQAVLVSDGKVYRRLDDASLPKPIPLPPQRPDGGSAAPPGAGAGGARPAAGASSASAASPAAGASPATAGAPATGESGTTGYGGAGATNADDGGFPR